MDLSRIYDTIESIRTEDVRLDMSVRLTLGVAYKKLGKGNIDFSCPICVNGALKKIRKLGKTQFLELINQSSEMTSKNNNPFILKGTGGTARTFFFKNERWSNDNLTTEVAKAWIKYSPPVLTNLLFSKEAAEEVKKMNLPKESVSAWMISNGKTYDDFLSITGTRKAEKNSEESTDKESKTAKTKFGK